MQRHPAGGISQEEALETQGKISESLPALSTRGWLNLNYLKFFQVENLIS